MKHILATAALTLPIMLATLPTPASAQEFIIRPVPHNRYYRVARRAWIPGHWEYIHHGRYWVPGHYTRY
ncbi:MAG: YXWGXW repeat-containing protein [Chroococcidiopsidaceae cyanobacterium CP_BM_ER_R8_30]|nr:YXWGXW repeat-containing protein [Chroococcidiopsidaceae cyanobacterium CP_BM_ER_R8_30]